MKTKETEVTRYAQQILSQVRTVVVGKDPVLLWVLAAILAKGHILLEDIPGVGKTTMALAFSRVLDLKYSRVQFTPDVLPSDVTGYSVPDQASGTMVYQPGAVLCNLFLADELNRATSRTQSALLEAMEEGQVTVDGVSHPLPKPFTVIATQNPTGAKGTQMLPESQLDRFMVCLSMGYPSHQDAVAILKGNASKPVSKVQGIISVDDLVKLRAYVNEMYVRDEIYEYIVSLVEATRQLDIFSMGASPRGMIAMLRMAKAMAVIDGRDYVTAEDVQKIVADTLGHRVKLSARGKAQGLTVRQAMNMLLQAVVPPRM